MPIWFLPYHVLWGVYFCVLAGRSIVPTARAIELMESEKDHFYAFVAVTLDEEVVGYATYNTVYYTWSGKSIYMDDLYVKSSHRSQGIGSQLIQAVINHAKGSGCHKVRWQVSEWNAPAIAFYKKLGAEINAVEKNCDLMLK